MTLISPARHMEAQIDLRLAPTSEAVPAARHSLDELKDLLLPEKLEDVRLVVSELVSNSVRHGRLSLHDRILLSVTVSGVSVRGRVCDPGPGFEAPSEPRPRADLRGGWGLLIVDRISNRWGVKRDGLMCVWFEIN